VDEVGGILAAAISGATILNNAIFSAARAEASRMLAPAGNYLARHF
jgi:hypothetical protein